MVTGGLALGGVVMKASRRSEEVTFYLRTGGANQGNQRRTPGSENSTSKELWMEML